ncbi:FAD/NAD(P)-binding domain-containing protein [Imleria badia]|nr:FAD/NAD(P)-binding domain-containing protein [Imleria badia]
MSLPDRTTVLIVGAGPAGLATALSLLHHGVQDFIIVDAVSQGQNSSRAVVIHAATLEALDAIGCGDDIVSQGTKSTAFNVRTRSTTLLSPHVESLKSYTRHAYVLVIPQNITERALERKLASFGVTIHRPLKVVGLRRNASNPQFSDVTFEDGRVITTKYVIGADGARSVVRTMAGIGFSDPTIVKGEADNNLAQMVLADVTFDTTDADELTSSITLSPDSLFLCFPLPSTLNESLVAEGKVSVSERIYRIGCGVPLEDGEIPHSPPKEYLQALVNRFGPYHLVSDPTVNPNSKPTCIKDIVWSSRFRNHASIADTTFARLGGGESEEGGAILLVGDAAHIHSPAGGQGMNLGLRDAIFLGEALTKHIRTTEKEPLPEADAILREFATVRHARAMEVIKLTKGILSITGMKHRDRMSWWCPIDSATVRAWMLWVLGSIPFIQRKMAWELSGLGRR